MTFEQAFAATKCGGRIRRGDWDSERFLRFEGQLIDEMGNFYLPRASDVLTENWEFMQ